MFSSPRAASSDLSTLRQLPRRVPLLAAPRDIAIDAVRGIAVFTMFAPNMIHVLEGTAPFLLRLYGSFAAPFFITLSGMMVAMTAQRKHYPLSHYLSRALLLLFTGAFVDVCINHYIPFRTIDVLYLAGISLPVLALFRVRSLGVMITASLLVFALTPGLQVALGYTDYPNEYYLSGARTLEPRMPSVVWKHWVVDGWFPIFPWLGMSLFGLALGKYRQTHLFADARFGWAAATLLFLGAFATYLVPPPALVRGDYSEIFYPPKLQFLVLTLGSLGTLLWAAECFSQWKGWRLLSPLGEAPLFFYVFHLAIIAYVIRPTWNHLQLVPFLGLSVAFASGMIAVGFGLRAWKRKQPKLHPRLRFFIGS